MERAAGNGKDANIIYGFHAVREALRSGARPLLRLLLAHQDRQLADIAKLAKAARVPIHVEPRSVLDRLVPSGKHQGVIGVAAAKRYAEVDEIVGTAKERGEPPFLVILDGLEDPHNVGAILRTAEAAGVHGVFIPERRAVGLTGAVAKASSGALDHLHVGCVTNLSRLIETLQTHGLWMYAVDVKAEKLYTEVDLRGPVALVLGGEGKGIRPGVLDKCDERIKIPIQGHVASLNVSAAAAITIFEAVRQRGGVRI
ncbi:23S rRNA (guanosine(2251)-2'-O)-methyltransferase RlmB [Nitrospira sp. Nam74]